ncbi:MAG: PspA/IM30 family protein [Pseudomonadota bacterium]
MIWTLRTLLRARTAEAEEAVIDREAPRLMAQHLREAEADLRRARHGLATLVAKRKAEARRREEAKAEIARRETEARAALEREEEALANDLVERIADLEDKIEGARQIEADLETRITALRQATTEGERRITTLAADLRAARAGRLARGMSGPLAAASAPIPSPLERAEALAKRMQESGREADDAAAALLGTAGTTSDDLDARVEEAGLANERASRRAAILGRLKTETDTQDSKGDA